MRVAGLFAGIGGLELGLARSGHTAELLCEIWDPAVAVLTGHFPDVPIHRDIRTLDRLPRDIELIAAGFPCQDLSQAGKTAGIAGERSGLVSNVFRLIENCSAELVLLENVPFMLRLARGRAMQRLTDEFEARGFRWAYRQINSLAFLPQRRERVFFLASRGTLDPADVLFADEAFPPDVPTDLREHAHGFYWTEGIRGLGWAADATPPLKNGSTVGIPSPPAILLPDGQIVKPDIHDAERLQGFTPDWTAPAMGVARPGIRWSLVGNAITVPVAEWLGQRLLTPQKHRTGRDTSLLQGASWPTAARFDGRQRWKVRISDYPVWRERPHLHEFLERPGALLSARATAGFLARAETGRLRFPAGFLDAVRRHLAAMDRVERSVQKAAA